jgi:hypothetical protein
MTATARKTKSAADVESLSDELELRDLLEAVTSMTDADPPTDDDRARDSDARSLRREGRARPEVEPHGAKLDLIAESRRIREECNEFVRRYQEAIGVRRSPRRTAPEGSDVTQAHERGLASASWRRKVLLHLLIEELV